MGAMASQINSLTIIHSTICSGADQRNHQSSASLAIVQVIHRSFRFDTIKDVSNVMCHTFIHHFDFGNLFSQSGACFNIKMSSHQYRQSHCGDKTILLSFFSKWDFPYWQDVFILNQDPNRRGYHTSVFLDGKRGHFYVQGESSVQMGWDNCRT